MPLKELRCLFPKSNKMPKIISVQSYWAQVLNVKRISAVGVVLIVQCQTETNSDIPTSVISAEYTAGL